VIAVERGSRPWTGSDAKILLEVREYLHFSVAVRNKGSAGSEMKDGENTAKEPKQTKERGPNGRADGEGSPQKRNTRASATREESRKKESQAHRTKRRSAGVDVADEAQQRGDYLKMDSGRR